MEIRDVSEELRSLAMECMEMGSMERPEVTWLKERYRDFMRRENITGRETERNTHKIIKKITPMDTTLTVLKSLSVMRIKSLVHGASPTSMECGS